MGLFDVVYVEPDYFCACGERICEFQTKDLDCAMLTYILKPGGILLELQDMKPVREIHDLHCKLRMYSRCDVCGEWNDFELKYTDGDLREVTRLKSESCASQVASLDGAE